jgi:hypothetical protein
MKIWCAHKCPPMVMEEKNFQVKKKKKKKKPNKSTEDNITHTIREVGNQLATNLIIASDNLSKVVTGLVERELKLKVNNEL